MSKAVVFTLAMMVGIVNASMADSDSSRVTGVAPSRPQPSLLGEVKQKRIKQTLFFEKVSDIINEERLLTAGYLTRKDVPFGEILDGQIENKTISTDDLVLINRGSVDGIKAGDQFYIYRRQKPVEHPDTGKKYGYIISIMGTLVVTEVKEQVSRAKIERAFNMLFKGDLILPKFSANIPALDEDRPLLDKSIDGTVMSVGDENQTAAEKDIVYLNVGREAGVDEGDIFGVFQKLRKDSASGKHGFRKTLGRVKVIMVRKETATAIVTKSTHEINIGDRVTYLQER